jgi:RNA-directed DNA polymerase
VNTGEPETAAVAAERRVLEIQTKLHRWASDDPDRRFDDLYNLVADPAFLLVAWARVRANKGARTAGVDGETARYIEHVRGVDGFLTELRGQLKRARFGPYRRGSARSPRRTARFGIWGSRPSVTGSPKRR